MNPSFLAISILFAFFLLVFASNSYVVISDATTGKYIHSLLVINKYGYIGVYVYYSKDVKKCKKIINIDKKNINILEKYNISDQLYKVIQSILDINVTSKITLYLNENSLCYLSFEYNIFSNIDRAVITGIINNDGKCLDNISFYDILEMDPVISILRKIGPVGIYVNYSSNSYMGSCISEIAGKMFYLPGNVSLLKKVCAYYLPSSLGLPRVVVTTTGSLLGFKTLGERFTLRVLVANSSVSSNSDSLGSMLSLPLMIIIKAPYMRPLKALIVSNTSRPKHIELNYTNETGFVKIVFDKCNCSAYELFLTFQTVKSGNYTIDVDEKVFTNKGVVTIGQYAWFIYPHKCGVIEVEAPPVSRYDSSSYLHFLIFSLIILFILAIYLVLYMRR
ncbi:hypothetical protein PYJP_06750 [Pyrofollis japonicus]|uniref:hypothetical protein n=1 Tax=Pyrofollis japonicus TaxID=3060460 RepID=UPI00295B17E3|nr:hypothetical protein [Pyrofollis japonicus]BEP17323.1 hypothetical protein PYJP_06750 [Pyrofollis japonicus]